MDVERSSGKGVTVQAQEGYLAYMLRLWRVSRNGETEWWGSLESPHTGQRWAFADVEKLIDFLTGQTQVSPGETTQVDQVD